MSKLIEVLPMYLNSGVEIFSYEKSPASLEMIYKHIGKMSLNSDRTNPINFHDNYKLALYDLDSESDLISNYQGETNTLKYFIEKYLSIDYKWYKVNDINECRYCFIQFCVENKINLWLKEDEYINASKVKCY